MTYISRADAIAAIQAIYNDCPAESVQRALFANALAAINALPAVTVTDDMAHRAQQKLPMQIGASVIFPSIDEVRAALEAALPDAPCKDE